MRLKYLNFKDCHQGYIAEKRRIGEFNPRNQGCWHSHVHALVRIAKTAYAIGQPLSESRAWLRQAANAFRELFALRGTSFYKQTPYKDGKPLPEETIFWDGYTSVDIFEAALVSLAIQDIELARELIELGRLPNERVSPRSEVCTTNDQTLSRALNALIASEMDIAHREAFKLSVRTATRIEKQIALTISAIATNGDMVTERDSLLFYHEKLAMRRENQHNIGYWFSLPALGLSFLAMHYRQY